MMRRTALALITLLATGCVTAGTTPATGEPPDELTEIKSRILELQRTAAMTRVEIDRLRQQVATLESRLGGAETPAAATRTEAAPPTMSPPPPSEPPPASPPARVEITELEVSPPERRPVETVTAPPPLTTPTTSSAGGPTAPVSEAAQTLYDRGYTLYHQGRYVDAESGFRRFLQAYPDTSLSDNAQYWIGESRFARGDYDGALAAFREVAQRYAGGNKVADSLLKAADCLLRLGDSESARATYDEVMRRFPGSAAAAMAEERRDRTPR